MSRKRPLWHEGVDGCVTPYDYGYRRGVLGLPFMPEVVFGIGDAEDYRQGYYAGKKDK